MLCIKMHKNASSQKCCSLGKVLNQSINMFISQDKNFTCHRNTARERGKTGSTDTYNVICN